VQLDPNPQIVGFWKAENPETLENSAPAPVPLFRSSGPSGSDKAGMTIVDDEGRHVDSLQCLDTCFDTGDGGLIGCSRSWDYRKEAHGKVN
jgi:hypothetical protein